MDLTDSELYECGGCSNFIPSSESDPPPPITYHVTECKPGDIHLQECDANTESAPALDESDTMVSQDCSFEASDAVKKQDTFTQADDFQDLSKENLEPSSNTVGSSEKIPQSVQVNGFSFNGPNRIGKSLGHTQDLFDETPNQPMRFSEPLNASKNNTNSSNSPFLSGLESHSSSLARLPSSASVLFNSSDGVGEGEDVSVVNDHEASYNDEFGGIVKSKGGAGSMMKKSPKQLVKNKISQSVDSILAVNVSAIIYRLDDTNDLIFDSRFNVKINDSNIKDAYHRLQNDNAKLINELSRLLKRECDNVGQIKTSDSMLSTSPPTNDSSHSNVLSSKSIFRSSSISTSNSDCVRPKSSENQGSDSQCVPFKSPISPSSSGSELFIPRSTMKNNVGHAVETKSPVRASTTSSSSSDLFIPRSANKRIHDLKDKQQCESSTTSNVAEVQSEPNSLRLNSFRSSLSSENVTIRDLSYRPSLTLVYETPSEDTVDESVHYPKNICNNEANGIVYQTDTEENSVSNDAAKKTVLEAPDKTLTPSKLFSGEQWVYGKWKSEKNYYAGKVYPSENCLRSLVIFEDGTRARIKPSDMITVYLLPVGTEVSAELKDDNEYWGDCIIEAHLSDPERPYKVICRTSNEIYCLRRGQVSVHESEVDNLKRRKLLPSNDDIQISVDNEIVSDTNSVTKICASPDVSLSNLVFDKRKSKPKIYRSSWVTPVKHLAPMEKNDDQQPKTLPSKLTASTQLRKRYRNQFKWNLPSSTRNGRFRNKSSSSNENANSAKKQRLSDLFSDNEDLLTQPMSLEMPITKLKDTNQKNNTNQMMFKKIQLSPLPKSRASIGLLRSLSHSLNIPIPSSSVFQGWTIILTGGVKNNTFGKSFDRNLIEQLVVACGGEIASEINPSLLNRRNGCESPELDEGFGRKMTHQTHFIAVVSTDCCRTLKYFQALATLGSVPLLRTEWLLDSCREDAKASGDESINEETRNWPLYLLRSYPGRYELPRGFISGSTEPISWWSVPVRYRSPAYQTIPAPSLFDLHGDWADSETTFRLVAIVTNDVSVFGPGWLNILSLACGSTKEVDESHQTSCNRILLIPLSEAFQRLSTLFPSIRSRCKSLEKKVNFVLVDKNNVTQSAIAFMKTLPVEMVTCDYFIHSLICGHLVDPKSSSYFSPLT